MNLIESIQENLKEQKDCIKEDEEQEVETVRLFNEFMAEVEKAGGLYGYIANNYTSMSQELLKEIAINAVYELDNDKEVIKDVAERYFDYYDEID